VIAHGYGSSVCSGHPESWLEGITMDNVKLFISHDPAAPYDKAVHALVFQRVKNLKLRNIEVTWGTPVYERWRSALYLEDIQGLNLEGLAGRQAGPGTGAAAVVLNRVEDMTARHNTALPGTGVFFDVRGGTSRNIVFWGNDLRRAEVPYRLAPEVKPEVVTAKDNISQED
jgi:hypothetical protein